MDANTTLILIALIAIGTILLTVVVFLIVFVRANYRDHAYLDKKIRLLALDVGRDLVKQDKEYSTADVKQDIIQQYVARKQSPALSLLTAWTADAPLELYGADYVVQEHTKPQ